MTAFERSLTTSIGLSASMSRVQVLARSLTVQVGLQVSMSRDKGLANWLCVASRDGGSVKTRDGTTWSSCAKDADGDLEGAYFAQFDNRLCVIRHENIGFAYSLVNDIASNWTDKPNFPNYPLAFTDLYVARDAGDDPILYFLTPDGKYYLDVFSNFVAGPTEISWEYDIGSGKKGFYWRGFSFDAVGKGIYQSKGSEAMPVGPDVEDGLAEDMQGYISDMIGVGFWLVIAVDGGGGNKSSILKKYITGKHWHTVYVGSVNTPIRSLMWDSGTLYFGEGTNVKSIPFSNTTDNYAKLSTHTFATSGVLRYPHFHSQFEAMPKIAHKLRAVTQDCNTSDTIDIAYRIDDDTSWSTLGTFSSSPRPSALRFPHEGYVALGVFDAEGVEFERIQFQTTFGRGDVTTNTPKLESLTLEYRVVPPVLWGWTFTVDATTKGDQSGKATIAALKTAIETGTLMSFYPDGDKGSTEYFVEVAQMPGAEKGTEFGKEGVFQVKVQEVID